MIINDDTIDDRGDDDCTNRVNFSCDLQQLLY